MRERSGLRMGMGETCSGPGPSPESFRITKRPHASCRQRFLTEDRRHRFWAHDPFAFVQELLPLQGSGERSPNRASPSGSLLVTAGRPAPLRANKKADVVEHREVFDHVGLLVNEPPGRAGLPFV
jgi:hypothetical protein